MIKSSKGHKFVRGCHQLGQARYPPRRPLASVMPL